MKEYNSKYLASDFIKVDHNTYIAKDDPRFLEKYLRYFPNDAEKLYHYGEQLEKKGMLRHALISYRRAMKNGYLAAEVRINGIRELQRAKKEVKNEKKQTRILPLIFLGFLNFCLLTGLLVVIGSLVFKEIFPVSTPIRQDNNINNTSSSTSHNDSIYLAEKDTFCEVEKESPLFITVIQNGLDRFKETNGQYPNKLEELNGKKPNNWLSYIPDNVGYEKVSNDQYVLEWEGERYSDQSNQLLSLIHYPKTNELGVMRGDQLLALYKVASGSTPMPFEESKVHERVVNPNGGTGALGTRGLVLDDNFAIHGTNDPSSIGKNVTLGCLRLPNEDIEILYPYISNGTPFYVGKGQPKESPIYLGGLPPLVNSISIEKELAPYITYGWKM